MVEVIESQGRKIRYEDNGHGKCVVLLHGYLESIEIWRGLDSDLAKRFRVVNIDLPGHGASDDFGPSQSIEQMAEAVRAVLDAEQVQRATLVGHSMGGYVALAFAELFPERLQALCLFHSHPFADPDEARENRDRQIALVLQGQKNKLCRMNVPKVFAQDNLEDFAFDVEYCVEVAQMTPDSGVVACLNAMKHRPDRTETLASLKAPFLYIVGKHDNFFPFAHLAQVRLPVLTTLAVFEHSGHQGFMEEADKALATLEAFLDNLDSDE